MPPSISAKPTQPPMPPMSEGAWIGTKWLVTQAEGTKILREREYEPEPAPRGGEREHRIGTRHLLHNGRIDRRRAEEAYAIQRPATSERAIDAGERPRGGVTVARWNLRRPPGPRIPDLWAERGGWQTGVRPSTQGNARA